MTWTAILILTVLYVPVALLLLVAFFRIMAYFVAIARAFPHVGRTGKIRYLLALSFMNFDTAGQLMTTDAGKAAHDQVLQRLNRGIRSFFYAFGAAIVAIAIAFGLELAGILPVA